MKNILLIALALFFYQCKSSKTTFNGDFEILDKASQPLGWSIRTDNSGSYLSEVDSNIKKSGKYSIRIEKVKEADPFWAFNFPIKNIYDVDSITLSGYIKTENVKSGFAALWARVDNASGKSISMDNMSQRGVKGTNDWKKVSLTIAYDSKNAAQLSVGGLLLGDGKAWFDQLEITANGKSIDKVKTIDREQLTVQSDTAFRSSSNIKDFQITPQRITNLKLAGQFWSFLKYHHPAIAKGEYNWDAELFRMLPSVISAKSNLELSKALETYLNKLPIPEKCLKCDDISKKAYLVKPNYGSLFDSSILKQSLIEKLKYILANRNTGPNYYLSLTAIQNPDFQTEQLYVNMAYPDAGYRLLSLYRYWGIINYYFPSRNLIGEDWNKALFDALPDFVKATNEQDYILSVLKLVARIKDSHAVLYGPNEALRRYKGKFALPIQLSFIEKKLVIIGLHSDTLGIKSHLSVGDEIVGINGITITKKIQQMLPYTSSSNYETQLRDIARNLIKSNDTIVKLTINRDGKSFNYYAATGPASLGYKDVLFEKAVPFKVMEGNIGYVFPGKFKNSMLSEISKEFKDVEGIIIDMRCYPSEFMPFTFGNYIKEFHTPFVKFSQGSIQYPGSFVMSEPIKNGYTGYAQDGSPKPFKGNVVVIVNAVTQSQAEYTTMAFQSSSKVRVLGSKTSGADGNVSEINLPGGLTTMISGLGVYYPDGTAAQRAGVKIDYKVYPTIKGIKAGRDELMEKAISVLNKEN
jgi:C-terminal processing protease CtpA/Prc